MASIFNSMIGAPPPDDSLNQAQLADALRRRERLGAIGVLTGDPAMASQGKILQGGAMDSANLLAQNREHGIDDAQTRRYQDWQAQHSQDVLDETKRQNTLMDAYRKAMLDIAQQKVDKTSPNNDKQIEQEIRQYATKMDSSGLTELQKAIQNFHSLTDPYTTKGEVPPGMGRMSGLPLANAFQGKDAQDIQGALMAVKNGIMRARSGLAVTVPEAERLAQELEQSVLNSGTSRVEAMQRLESLVGDRAANMQTLLSPEALEEYARRRGRTGDSPAPAAGPSAPNVVDFSQLPKKGK